MQHLHSPARSPRTRSIVAVALATCAASAQQQATELVSQSTNASQALHDCEHASISNDGRFVGFSTRTLKLDPSHIGTGDNQIYVRDRVAGVTQRVNLTSGGAIPGPNSFSPSISASGCAVAFVSDAGNLTLTNPVQDLNQSWDVFVRWARPLSGGFGNCTANGPDVCVSSFLNGGTLVTPCSSSDHPCISGDGQYVAFHHYVSGVALGCDFALPSVFPAPILGDPNVANVWLADVTASPPTLYLCSDLAVGPGVSPGESTNPVVSFDGNFVAFESLAELVPNAPNPAFIDIFRFERTTRSIIQISDSMGVPRAFTTPSISDDGSVIAYDDSKDVFVAVIAGGFGTGSVITSSATGAGGFDPSVSPDGRFVAFQRQTVGGPDHVFVFDRLTSLETELDVDAFGAPGNGMPDLWRRALSVSAVVGAFTSTSTDFVANDSNGVADVFTHGPSDDFRPFCFGDGSGTSCLCGNAITPSFGGCPHSLSVDGARLSGAGVPSIAFDSSALVVDSVPATTSVWFDSSMTAIPAGVVSGDGLLCLGGTPKNIGSTSAVGGVASFGFHAQIPSSVSIATAALAGQTHYFQARYRNAAAFCTVSTVNSTNALQVTWRP